MYKYTTPTFTLTLPEGTDLGLASEVVCTLAHDGKEVASKTGDDLVIDGNVVEVYFSQEETKNFPLGVLGIQLNWTYIDGGKTKRACSTIAKAYVDANLYKAVI